MTPPPTSRLDGFACGHFVVTSLCAPVLFFATPALMSLPAPLPVLLMMALYVPAGWVVSTLRRWHRPTPRQGLKAVLSPALVAWGWAFGGWLLFVSPTLLNGLGFWMLMSTYFLACPSFVLMITALGQNTELSSFASFGITWYLSMLLAGLLPPLLFFLGSLLPHRIKEDLNEKTDCACGGTLSPGVPGSPVGGEPPQPGGDPALRSCPPDGAGTDGGGLPERDPDTGAV